MELHFYKYQGTGNDFILLDNRDKRIHLTTQQIAFLCDRRFGIGADGLMLLELADGYDFRMVYYNSDGSESTMCGNGGRCITAFARKLGVIGDKATFIAIDGPHEANFSTGDIVNLQMQNVTEIEEFADHSILNTGSPHYVLWTDDVANAPVFEQGRNIRNQFPPKGINVNFVQKTEDALTVRTYERGVEDETYSCGTGVTAAAIAASGHKTGDFQTAINTPGGSLKVSFTKRSATTAENVVLSGPAAFVFEGGIAI
ncbi:diaminopimelate epimerase [Polluticoccus soli]|uniref:diaminopimelate epimerase n=1 Tax=Polluticoccus soli TaxID=3034150 RepID=UPI0023E2182E|nr:diaminopimelate epimerase [Flavipsychrobacter sp. JY13-12]